MRRLGHLGLIAHDMGVIFEILGAATMLVFLVLFIYSEWSMIIPMASVPITFLLLGYIISRVPRKEFEPRLSIALVGVALTWLAIAFVGALPFFLGMHMSITDSVFEAMSGWTGTGFSVMTSLNTTPHVILFWRSFMQWIGGIGVVAFGITMLSRSSLIQFRLYRSEGRSEALMPSIVSTGRRMWGIYIALTAGFTAMILITGIPLWDALNIVMTTIATGGFSLHDAGISFYQNSLLEGLLLPVMLAGAVPFKLYFFFFSRGRIEMFWKEPTVRLLLALALSGSLVVSFNLFMFNEYPLTEAVRQGFFCTISGLTCCGLQNSSMNWGPIPVIVIIFLMMIGGASGSTSGGIKLNRIILGFEGLLWWFKRFFVSSKVLVPFKHNGRNIPKKISELELSKNMLIIVLWVLMIFLATVISLHIAPASTPTQLTIFDLVSAASNVGLGSGYFTPAAPIQIKWLFIFVMWIGRLEIVPVLILWMSIIRGFEAV
ncbi:MAG TPA: potassium transporter TrkG [Methanoregulaceae archaeon]|nr:potassium transporter TrkG [Methanoregulaceae archaeon]